LLCTNTHDTKRSADVRARLDVLSECHEEWHRHFTLWRRLNSKHRSVVKGRLAPDTNTEYLLYQTLLGIWPSVRRGRRTDDLPESAWFASATGRLEQYMLKAVREAKVRTSWTSPDADFEEALKKFIGAIMDPSDGAPFLPDVARFASRVAPLGHWNALSRVLLHLASPGTPDTYRGDELWFFALVDPDNRQPVDYEERRKLLEEIDGGAGLAGGTASESFFQDPADPRLKLLVVKQLLNARRDHPDLFSHGTYRPLFTRAGGERADHVFAFARSHGGQHAIAIASRLPAQLELTKRGSAAWGSTALDLPDELRGRRWRSAIAGPEACDVGGALELARVLSPLPFVLLLSTGADAKS
jgi:(1->4)-alpha-D-glucan 1-alpha-D-glucosylmutase